MVTWDEVRRLALALPETVEDGFSGGQAAWRVRDKTFAWQRPLRKSDLAALGPAAPDGPILGVRVADLDVKEAVLRENAGVCFTTPHFNGYPAVLVRLDEVAGPDLAELLTEAWLCRALKRLAAEYLQSRA